jgi:hypothetical protein
VRTIAQAHRRLCFTSRGAKISRRRSGKLRHQSDDIDKSEWQVQKMANNPDEFIANLLEWDLEPPFNGYSHAEYAASVARQLSDAEVRHIAALAVKSLFAGMAADVLDGLYDACPQAFTSSDAMQWISHGFDVNSGATVNQFMMERLSVIPDCRSFLTMP